MAEVKDLGQKSIESLDVPSDVKVVLKDIQAEIADAYRESFIAMVKALNEQASALARIQETLRILVQQVAPQLKGNQLPIGIQVVENPKDADLAKAIVVADPIGSGYSLSQTTLGRALGISQPDVSILVNALKINDDGECAVEVRRGRSRSIINYHNPRAVDRLRKLIQHPPSGLERKARQAIERARQRLKP